MITESTQSLATQPVLPGDRHDRPLLLTATEVAVLCGMGRSTWWRLFSSGKAPAPVRLGRVVRWRRDELLAWLEEGCPPREQWERRRKR